MNTARRYGRPRRPMATLLSSANARAISGAAIMIEDSTINRRVTRQITVNGCFVAAWKDIRVYGFGP
jgi:hypothetical protein